MTFDKTVNYILEDQSTDEKYTILSPLDYSEALLISPYYNRKNTVHCLFYKVTNDKEKNIEYEEDKFLPEIPEEIANNWVHVQTIAGKNASSRLYAESFYIINGEREFRIRDMDVFDTYLKPTNLSDEVKDTFGDMYTEL
jgi:hypothetical protein